jgi:replication-associated recombination protein RarA
MERQMNLIDLNNYLPKTISDIVFGNDESEAMINDIANGRKPFPTFGKNGIILYGIWGTGKTTLARMLPSVIERVLSKKPLYDETFIQCKQGMNGADLMRKIEQQAILISANYSDKHYFILDEIDNLTDAAQTSLKAAMNVSTGIFILTTNHIDKVERGILNRSVLVEMNAASPQQWLPFAQRILKDCDVGDVSDDELIPLIAACNGSVRDIADSALTIAARKVSKGA